MAVIVFPPAVDWYETSLRNKKLIEQLAQKGHMVYYCSLKEKSSPGIEQQGDHIFLVHNVEEFLERVIPAIRRTEAGLVAWCISPVVVNTLKRFRADLTVFDCTGPCTSPEGYEREMVWAADIVFADSDCLYNYLMVNYPEKEIFFLNNGCDLVTNGCDSVTFNYEPKGRPEVPSGLSGVTGAVIGYFGPWDERVDTELVQQVCSSFPRHRVAAVGQHARPHLPSGPGWENFSYIGPVPWESIPDYLAHLDVGIFPYQVNETARCAIPVELYTCLAAGKPVVVTALPDLEPLRPLVDTAANYQEFIRQIEKNLTQGDKYARERASFARANSWAERYLLLEKVISRKIPGFAKYQDHDRVLPLPAANFPERNDFFCVYPTADVTINNYHPEMNLDFDPAFVGRVEDSIYRYLVKFDLSGEGPRIKKAVLALFIERCDSPLEIKRIEAVRLLNDWEETSLVWDNRPYLDTEPGAVTEFKDHKGWMEWDVSKMVQTWIARPETNFGLMLKGLPEHMSGVISGVNRHSSSFYSPKLKIWTEDMTEDKNIVKDR